MAHGLQSLLDAPIIELDTIDSTNNYAMRLIDADTAQDGLTIVAASQTAGRGQRANNWVSAPGDSLLMSMITVPNYSLDQQAVFNCAVALSVADVIQSIYKHWDVHIKWPNDIIINDKKAGGILIENVIRGAAWTYSTIGIGINLLQVFFSADLPYATSLKIESGQNFTASQLLPMIRESVFRCLSRPAEEHAILEQYNNYLYHRYQPQAFTNGGKEWSVLIDGVGRDGKLRVTQGGSDPVYYNHGEVQWKWG